LVRRRRVVHLHAPRVDVDDPVRASDRSLPWWVGGAPAPPSVTREDGPLRYEARASFRVPASCRAPSLRRGPGIARRIHAELPAPGVEDVVRAAHELGERARVVDDVVRAARLFGEGYLRPDAVERFVVGCSVAAHRALYLHVHRGVDDDDRAEGRVEADLEEQRHFVAGEGLAPGCELRRQLRETLRDAWMRDAVQIAAVLVVAEHARGELLAIERPIGQEHAFAEAGDDGREARRALGDDRAGEFVRVDDRNTALPEASTHRALSGPD